jgi:hypothetical protein
MNRFLAAGAVFAVLISCKPEKESPTTLKTGIWRGTIEIQGQQLPFNFELVNDADGGYDIYLRNADERLLLDEIAIANDSIDIGLHIFDANIKAAIKGGEIQCQFYQRR